MRPAVLSVSAETASTPLRNALLAHAGYGVMPVATTESALEVLRLRHVCAVVISQSISPHDRVLICEAAHSHGVPSVILDAYESAADACCELRVNPLDGPEVFLDALQVIVGRTHSVCVYSG